MIYLDVRTPEEFALEHYPSAVNFDVQLLMAGKLPDIPKDIVLKIYCRSGARAGVAKSILEKSGFSNVENVGSLDDIS